MKGLGQCWDIWVQLGRVTSSGSQPGWHGGAEPPSPTVRATPPRYGRIWMLTSELQALLLEVSIPCPGIQLDRVRSVDSGLCKSGLTSEPGREAVDWNSILTGECQPGGPVRS